MPNDNEKEVVRPVAGSEVTSPVEASQAGSEGLTGKRPYKAPELRSLGKVAELTFAGSGSVTDNVGALKRSGGSSH
jgi:hypothetical protein